MDSSTMRNTQVIAVGNQKGGVGKTTNTVHIAAALAERGRRCLIIDLDMNHGATRHFGIEPDAFLGSFEMLIGEEEALDVVISSEDKEEGVNLPSRMSIIPARRKLENIDAALTQVSRFITPNDLLEKPLKQLRGRYDYIFLDTAPSATTPTKAAYTMADWFILTALAEPFAVDGLKDALIDIQDAQKRANPGLKLLGVVICGVNKRTNLSNNLIAYVDEAFATEEGRSIKFKTIISRSTVIPETQKAGQTLFQTHSGHKVTDQYRTLATEIEERLGMVPSRADVGTEAEPEVANG